VVVKNDIRSLSYAGVEEYFSSIGEKTFRTKQVYEWLWKKGCRSFDEMTNLPVSLRTGLSEHFLLNTLEVKHFESGKDGTFKAVFGMHDGYTIEGVLIPADGRVTACISSQAGCSLGCTFCATGMMGFHRNLTAAEIIDQIWLLQERSGDLYQAPISNIVLMGMGEPLLNYPQVKRAVEIMTGMTGMGISPQRITLSTVGMPKMIRQMADDGLKIQLAISLHAVSDQKRMKIIPINRKHPVNELTEALVYYHRITGKRFTIEYLLLENVNDSLEDARELAIFCRNFPVKINLIEFNPVEGIVFARSPKGKMDEFREFLESKNLIVNIRKSRGKDIDAACGQLAVKT